MSGSGTAILDFGAFPGKTDTSVAVTGQSGIASGSLVEAWIRPVATAVNDADNHIFAEMKVIAGNIVAGTGFTIYGVCTDQISEPSPSLKTQQPIATCPRLWGTFNVGWVWS